MLLLTAIAGNSPRPKLLDLFSGAGGAGVGYHRAGFDVTGVDIHPQKNYPFKFIQADALDYVAQYGWMYDAIHASPPCQAHSKLRAMQASEYGDNHVDLIPHTRYWLQSIGKPYIIENVEGAPLRDYIVLCGTYFGLKVFRHRWFESNVLILQPSHIPHRILGLKSAPKGSAPGKPSTTGVVTVTGHFVGRESFAAMGVNWMSRPELAQAIPPAYTEYVGRQLMQHVLARNVETIGVSLTALAAA